MLNSEDIHTQIQMREFLNAYRTKTTITAKSNPHTHTHTIWMC